MSQRREPSTSGLPNGSPTSGPSRPGTLSRRSFLVGGGAAALGTVLLPSVLPRYAFATPGDPSAGDVIVVVFLRGGADGLSIVAPFSDTAGYQALRGAGTGNDVAVPPPNAGDPANTAIDLGATASGHSFGLHPAATGLGSVWDAGDLAIVHAVGMPAAESATRSHFESQANWERGTAATQVGSGYLGRYLTSLTGASGIPGVGRASTLQPSLWGDPRAMAMASVAGFGVTGFRDNPAAISVLAEAYPPGDDPIAAQGAATLAAVDLVVAADPAQFDQNAALYEGITGPAAGLAQGLYEIAQLVRADVGLRVACVDMGGWDTHDAMGPASGGLMRSQVQGLSDALAAFHQDLGPLMDEVTLVTQSEFGRTVDVNGNNGTDHGRGSCLFVMGRNVNQGIFGDYPAGPLGNGPEGDLTVANDVRSVLTEVLVSRGQAPDPAGLFPGYTHSGDLGVVA